jgi:deoxycytidylate deaminase
MIDYPYLPEGKQFQYVPFDHPHMIAAEQARKDCAGDSLYPVGIVLVKDGEVVARAGNGFNRGSGTKHVCPRVVLDCPSGTGYELCSLHDSIGHAETMLMQVAAEQGINIAGSDTYMFGHWWCCEHCWKSMIDAGVRNVYVVDDAHERFSRDRVFAETLTPSCRSIFFSHAFTQTNLSEMKELIGALDVMCVELGCSTVIPFRDGPHDELSKEHSEDLLYRWSEQQIPACDVLIAEVSSPAFGVGGEIVLAEKHEKPVILLSKKGINVSEFVTGNPAVVYHVQYESIADAVQQVRNVLRQL